MSASSPVSRALRALELMQARPGITADELAAELGVTSRAARRYVAMLREADIAVDSVRGRYGGYQLGRGVRLPPLRFTSTEALGLVMAALDAGHDANDDSDVVGSALRSLLRALPAEVATPAVAMRAHATAVLGRREARPDRHIVAELIDAVVERARVHITYRSAAGREWEEDVEPWAVVDRFGYWYLLCFSRRVEDVRTYRIDRVVRVAITSETFVPPTDLDPVDLLQRHLGSGREYDVRVVFHASYDEVAPFITPIMGVLTPVADRCQLSGTTSNPGMVAGEWLAAIPFDFTVEGSAPVQRAVAALARRLGRAAR